MAGRVPEHAIRDIVRRADIVRLVSRYTRLHEKGGKHWGLCPFHTEKTPSFSVEPDEGLYYCFGCHEGGNIFTLLKKLEGLEFFEALQQLAQEAGVNLQQYMDTDTNAGGGRPRDSYLRRINDLAAVYYGKCLQKARGADAARGYLESRKIDGTSIDKWRVGYAPDGWDNIVKLATRRDLDLNTFELAGLVIPRRDADSFYDRFRNRLIFPVADRNEGVIGFGARALDDQQDAKYLNSPETPIFNKGSCFYGLNHSRTAIRRNGTAVIVEGYTDVIMAHQHGFDNVIAVLGTALTDSHAAILSRLCEKVILIFDPDAAGQESARKSIRTLLASDIEPDLALLPDGLDPCDFLTQHGKEAFERCLAESDDFLKFCLKKAHSERDLARREERTELFRNLAEMACAVPNEVRREMMVREIASELNIEPKNAFDYIGRLARQRRRSHAEDRDEAPAPKPPDAEDLFLGELLTFLLVHPEYQKKMADAGVFDAELFADTARRQLLVSLLNQCAESGPVSESAFLYSIDESDLVQGIRESVEKERRYASGNKEERLQAYVNYLEKRKKRLSHLCENRTPENEEKWLKAYVEIRRQEECI